MGTGILYAAIVVAWAAYLLPVVKHRRERAADPQVSTPVSTAMRVLGKRSSGARARSRAATGIDSAGTTATAPPSPDVVADARTPVDDRERRSIAAARRRRVLALIVATALVVAVFAYVGTVAWWTMAIPGALFVAFLAVARWTVRSSRRRTGARGRSQRIDTQTADLVCADATASADGTSAALSSTASVLAITSVGEPSSSTSPGSMAGAGSGVEDAEVGLTPDPAVEAAAAWVAHSPVDAWDPLPITLPTYVTKDAAPTRRVRTIDLTGTAAFSAGRLPEASLLSRQADSMDEVGESAIGSTEDGRRATG